MVGEKKLSKRLAPLLARYDDTPPSFGTRIKDAVKVVKEALANGKGKRFDSSSPG